jgi:hypothetical protein
MDMRNQVRARAFAQTVCVFLATLCCEFFPVQRGSSSSEFVESSLFAYSETTNSEKPQGSADSALRYRGYGKGLATDGTTEGILAIPTGTILPIRLNSAISSTKSRPGQVITGRIMQDVPLSPGVRIRAGSKVIGHILERTPASSGAQARISFQFDQLVASHQTISISTNLRAIAGFVEVRDAQTPPIGPSESDVYQWLTTVQVGGDVVYGDGGPVTPSDNPNQIVGKKVADGVLGQVRAKEGTECRGAIDGNDSPQALWVFSTDACGTYGLEDVRIAHAGRTEPIGVIVLISEHGNLNIAGGAGVLLRVNASGGQ